MIIFPAIDLKGGQVVRLMRGEMASATIFNEDPVAQAQAFEAQGFEWLHLVDLDGALEGRSVNETAVHKILFASALPVQLGGGIRDRAAIAEWLEAGVRRVILGTIAAKDPDLVKEVAQTHAGRIAVGIDARDGFVAVQGWTATADMTAIDLARRFEDAGVTAIIYTDVARDGMGTGLNLEETAALASAVTIPVIASGGIGSIEDLRALIALNHPNIQGVIIGRALYDGRVDPAAALALAKAG
ncbi:MAG: 1-(5-phosphoribosyl)-5-[(5-phosphoribosylamino)methylideneamino]imidazole-4-carboxamide isomerase [Alphaproteobacteria bacterium]|nr:1-(5-phosphoribosyl)-5-[(5-phosphoribosylamino)methylideneamino]imidazole-4-carboxamide isomerase [Alphaproteobacteria bacterium]